jgi:hypothetical protein
LDWDLVSKDLSAKWMAIPINAQGDRACRIYDVRSMRIASINFSFADASD